LNLTYEEDDIFSFFSDLLLSVKDRHENENSRVSNSFNVDLTILPNERENYGSMISHLMRNINSQLSIDNNLNNSPFVRLGDFNKILFNVQTIMLAQIMCNLLNSHQIARCSVDSWGLNVSIEGIDPFSLSFRKFKSLYKVINFNGNFWTIIGSDNSEKMKKLIAEEYGRAASSMDEWRVSFSNSIKRVA
jgi:hypothetical protein